jgi:NAD(P)-dependent dehydrogenase (short-subunit alcohol dehydrogenase family)
VSDEPTRQRPLAVVTGASRGFGLEVARALSAEGWEVVTLSRSRTADLDQVAFVTQVRGDVADADLASLTAIVGDRPVELLVNNAGIGGTGMQLEALRKEELEDAFSVNVLGPARVAGALLPNLRRGAHPLIVNVSSRLGSLSRQASGEYQHVPTSYAYRISKAAQNMLTVCMAVEFGGSIRVWAVHPGQLRTAMAVGDANGDPAEAAQRLIALVQRDTQTQLAYVALDEGHLPW